MFLIRIVFWLSIVVILLPGDPQSDTPPPRVTVFETLSSFRAVAADFSGFCDRNPDVCVTGGTALKAFAEKAQNGARVLFRYLDEGVDPVGTEDDQDTLTDRDRSPAWQGPEHPGTV
jgi:hypothetical protein